MKISLIFLGLFFFSCSADVKSKRNLVEKVIPNASKIAGFSLEMPSDSIPLRSMEPVVKNGANWVALIRYSIIREGKAKVEY